MPFPRALSRYTRGRVNKVTLRFAGHAAFADLEHVGRRSGIVRHTPLRAFRGRDKVVIGVNFGRESDWLKNIRLGAPRVVPVIEGVRDMPWMFGVALRYVIHTADCVELPVVSSTPAEKPAGPRT
jgi:hypothetical protein